METHNNGFAADGGERAVVIGSVRWPPPLKTGVRAHHKLSMWNTVEHGDNLDIMRTLPSESIDLIYCDILYGTGRDFGDYKDLPAKRDVIEAFYRPRLQEMHRLLKDTGSIYLQMDSRINHWIRCLMDDVFGYKQFLNEIVWCYESAGQSKKRFSPKHDAIVLYTKTGIYIFNVRQIMRPRKSNHLRISFDINGEKVQEKTDPKTGKIYRYPFRDGLFPLDFWNDIQVINGAAYERVNYQTQKPEALLERIIKASSNEGDLVADFFCGSGTTLAVAKRLNRQYFGCDSSQKAVDITNQRLERTEVNTQLELASLRSNNCLHVTPKSGVKNRTETLACVVPLFGASEAERSQA
jgi:DNA modification methylase